MAVRATENKEFLYHISKLVVNFESKMDNCFLELEVGGQYQEVTSVEAEEKKVKKTRVDKDGKTVEFEVTDYKVNTQLMVYKPRAAHAALDLGLALLRRRQRLHQYRCWDW